MKIGKLQQKAAKLPDNTDICVEVNHTKYEVAFASKTNLTARKDVRSVLLLVAGDKLKRDG